MALGTSWTTKDATVLTDSYGETVKIRAAAKRGDIDYANQKVTITVMVSAVYSGTYISDASGKLYIESTAGAGSKSATKITSTRSDNQIKKSKTISYSNGTASGFVRAHLKLPNWGKDKSVTLNFDLPSISKYTITFNANGGSGGPTSATKWQNKALKLSGSKPTRSGYTFMGWGTSATTTSVAYAADGTIAAGTNKSFTLYAIWTANDVHIDTCTISYDANGGTDAPVSQTHMYGTVSTLAGDKPIKDKYVFLGWSASSSAVKPTYIAGGKYVNNSFTDGDTITLYAVWKRELNMYFNVPYVTYGSDEDASTTATEGGSSTEEVATQSIDALHIYVPDGSSLNAFWYKIN